MAVLLLIIVKAVLYILALTVSEAAVNIVRANVQHNRYHSYRYANDRIFTARSKLHCAVLCKGFEDCVQGEYNQANKVCRLPKLTYVTLDLVESQGTDTFIFNDAWRLVFKGCAGVTPGILGTFTDPKIKASSEPRIGNGNVCRAHYKHELVDNWTNGNITQVKLNLYKDGKSKVELVFTNRKEDTKTSWFTPGNLLSASPWNDLVKFPQLDFGFQQFLEPRIFFVHAKNIGCEEIEGWMVITEKTHCSWDPGSRTPIIRYSSQNTRSLFKTMPTADLVAIFVKTR